VKDLKEFCEEKPEAAQVEEPVAKEQEAEQPPEPKEPVVHGHLIKAISSCFKEVDGD
jgi:hypothetical protein